MAEWRFGESDEDAGAWAEVPTQLHVYVDFRLDDSPESPWHRIIAVTDTWVHTQLRAAPGRVQHWPALIVVPQGPLPQMKAAINGFLADGKASVIAHNAAPLTPDYTPPW